MRSVLLAVSAIIAILLADLLAADETPIADEIPQGPAVGITEVTDTDQTTFENRLMAGRTRLAHNLGILPPKRSGFYLQNPDHPKIRALRYSTDCRLKTPVVRTKRSYSSVIFLHA